MKLTIGSDSHHPLSVGQHFDTVLPLLYEKGFRDLFYHRQRKRIRIDLADALPQAGELGQIDIES